MAEKYKNKYRIESTRMPAWDYGWKGAYFITLVTKNREHYFGDIKDGKMIKSELGLVLENEWLKTPRIRPDMNIILDEYCVMPNHFHAIIKIGRNQYNKFDNAKTDITDDTAGDTADRDAMHRVSTANPADPDDRKNKFGPQRKNLASIIRGFKSAVTIYARKNNIDFAWQPNYHDHIIRNKTEYFRIKKYIINNPAKWDNDKFIKE